MRSGTALTSRAAPRVRFWASLAAALLAAFPAAAQPSGSSGTISGRVVSAATQEPVAGATLRVPGLELSAATDAEGRFVLRGVPPGIRALEVRRIGYAPAVRSDIAVGVARPAEVLVELQPAALQLEAVTVAPPLFASTPPTATPVSTQTLTAEEVRRAPGVQEDLVRALSVAGGIAPIPAGPRNDLLVRGGAAFENLFVVDGVEVPNINHFGTQGSTGGAVSLVNVAFVREASISAGGFGARYGDRTSSVADIRLREGSTERRSGALNLSATGVTASAEGPLWRNASFLAGVRRSYLDLLFELGGVPLVPAYTDATVKAVWRPTPADRLSFLAIGAADRVTFDNATADNRYENARALAPAQDQYFSGATWQRSLPRGVATVTLGRTWTRFRTVQLDSGTAERAPLPVLRAYATEGETSLRADLALQPSARWTVELGGAARYAGALEYDLLLDGGLRRDAEGTPRPLRADTSFSALRGAAYAQAAVELTPRLRASFGGRVDGYGYLDGAVRAAPRASLSYRVGERGTVTLAGGRYWQAPPLLWLVGDPSNPAALRPFRADHLVASVATELRRDLRLQVEGYVKRYALIPRARLSPPGRLPARRVRRRHQRHPPGAGAAAQRGHGPGLGGRPGAAEAAVGVALLRRAGHKLQQQPLHRAGGGGGPRRVRRAVHGKPAPGLATRRGVGGLGARARRRRAPRHALRHRGAGSRTAGLHALQRGRPLPRLHLRGPARGPALDRAAHAAHRLPGRAERQRPPERELLPVGPAHPERADAGVPRRAPQHRPDVGVLKGARDGAGWVEERVTDRDPSTNRTDREEPMPEMMQAVGFRRYGGPEVLERVEVPVPEPGPGQVRIRVAAAGVNPADWRIRGGAFRFFMRPAFPFVTGSDVAGVVDAVGPGASRFAVGDRVFTLLPTLGGGACAAFCLAADADVARVPDGIGLAHAATVPLAALTALQALEGIGLTGEDRVLVNGASGGVGSFGVQVARALGTRVDAGCSAGNAGWVRELGAERVLDYQAEDVTRPAEPYDVVLDAVAAHPYRRWRRAVRRGGRVAVVSPIHGNPVSRLLAALDGRRLVSILVRPDGPGLSRIADWLAAGAIRPVVERLYAFEEAADAHRRSETGRARGKLVVVVDPALAGLEAGAAASTAGLATLAAHPIA
jgi:NADPH:quinone reductase-like Zn-dependent oxidoreductase